MSRFTMGFRIFVLLCIFAITGSTPTPSSLNYSFSDRSTPSLSESLELTKSTTTTESQSTSTTTTTVTPTTVSVTPTPLSVSTSTETVTKPYTTTTTDISTNKPQLVNQNDPSPKFENNENKLEKSNNNENWQQPTILKEPLHSYGVNLNSDFVYSNFLPSANSFVNPLYYTIRRPQFNNILNTYPNQDPVICYNARDIWNLYQRTHQRQPPIFWPQYTYTPRFENLRIATFPHSYYDIYGKFTYNPEQIYNRNYYPFAGSSIYPDRNYFTHSSNYNSILGNADIPIAKETNINAQYQGVEAAVRIEKDPATSNVNVKRRGSSTNKQTCTSTNYSVAFLIGIGRLILTN